MKMIVVFVAFSCVYTGVTAQTQKKPVTGTTARPAAVKKPVTTGLNMKSSLDSFSYAVGLSIANFYKEQGVKDINSSLVVKALNDVKNGKPMLTEEQTNTCIVGFMQEAKSEKASASKKEGEAFLAENKKKSGVVSLASGLQYEVMKEGTGAKPTADDQVKVHYHGTLLDGTIFDSSVQRGEPIVLGLRNVIPGWTEALQLMPVGSKWKLFIPSNLGYGDNQAGPLIKPGSTLIFEVELLEIVKN